MRTRLFILGTIAAMLLSCGQKADKNSSNPDATAKEIAQEIADTKSYYIEYKTTMDMQGMKSTSVSKQWIDIKNDRLVMETETENEMMGQKTKESALTIGKDGYTYVISLTNKTGLKMKSDGNEEDPMDNIKPDDNETFRQMIEKEGGKIIGNEDFLGKDCIVIEMTSEGTTMKMWYYKGIPLKMTSDAYVMEAVKFEEGISIPDSKLEIPEDITISEMPVMN